LEYLETFATACFLFILGHDTNVAVNGHYTNVPPQNYQSPYQTTSRPHSGGHISLNSVSESIKADRSIRMWKMEAFKVL
jgi:hypothetical protein